MNFQHYLPALIQLGNFFQQEANSQPEYFKQAYLHNNWFTAEYVSKAFLGWHNQLTEANLINWLSPYTMPNHTPKKVAIIMAGNIPLVGLHDLLAVLVTGNIAVIKPSSDDEVLMKKVVDTLLQINPELQHQIQWIQAQPLPDFDAVIATGSNNTNRYFNYYFKNKPSVLRKNRNSIAVLTGNETPADYEKLGEDIFTYFGLGCRNVSKLYVPKGYDIAKFYQGIESFHSHIYHHKYANNYTYHKAILLMNLSKHFDNDFLLLKQDQHLASPLGMMFYEEYDSIPELTKHLQTLSPQIQCMVGNHNSLKLVPFGQSQEPALTDYADGVDTIDFLIRLNA